VKGKRGKKKKGKKKELVGLGPSSAWRNHRTRGGEFGTLSMIVGEGGKKKKKKKKKG